VVLAQTQEKAAEGTPQSSEMYRREGARNVSAPVNMPFPEVIALLNRARGVWIPGGDQNRFTKTFPETSGVPAAIRAVYLRGGVVGGTSAGASLQGDLMPTGEPTKIEGLRKGATDTAPGLGLLPGLIVDQHFIVRNRLPRLLAAVLEHSDHVGMGIDEGAWVVVHEDVISVFGGQVIVLTPMDGGLKTKDTAPAPLLRGRIVFQVLTPGDQIALPRPPQRINQAAAGSVK
jgi:cyanophycinase